jgi:anti-sigma B factor antagonist
MFERSRTGSIHVVRGDDPINSQFAEPLKRLLEECLGAGQPRIVMDLAKVSLLDSAGLELLLDYQDRCTELGGMMKLAAPSQLCRDALTITGVLDRFEVFEDALSAVGSFAQ